MQNLGSGSRGDATGRAIAVAAGSVATAVVVRLLLGPALGGEFPFATLFFAVLLSAAYGGLVAALAATVLGAAAAVWLLLPGGLGFGGQAEVNLAGLLLYVAVSVGIALIGGALRRAQQRAEAAAAQSAAERERLQVTLQSIGDAVIATDAAGRVASMNPIAEQLTGWPVHQARWRPLTEVFRIVNEQTRAPVANPVGKVIEKGHVVGLANHTVLIARDGREIPIDDSAAPIRDGQSNLIGVVLVFRDVTARRRAEEARALLAAAVESSEDAIVTKTLDSVITSWNRGAERLFGYTASEAIGQPIALIIPPDRRDEEAAILERLRRGERIEHYETVRVAKSGRRIEISLSISPVHDASGRIAGASKVARDITEQRKAEEALRAADRRKDEFLATLAHELRNPLAPVRNSLEIMKRAGGDADAIDRARTTIDRQMAHLERLVDDLLDVSRITQDKLELRPVRVELASIVYQAIDTVRPLIDGARHELSVTLPPEPVELRADPVRLAQVVSNLLGNAARYTDPGGRIRLAVERDGDAVEISVADTGVGIAADMLPRVFERFAQIPVSGDRFHGGLGIGLWLVRRLVEMHGGSVRAASDGEGRGSEFVVRLPIEAPLRPLDGAPPRAPAPPPATRRRILVVDDNRDAADSLATLLGLFGHETRLAHDGQEALDAAASFRPEVVLMDIGLPRLDGHEAARRIREQPWGKAMVLVALTGWGQEQDRRKSIEVGFDRHLVKPVDFDELSALLSSLDERPSSQSEPAR